MLQESLNLSKTEGRIKTVLSFLFFSRISDQVKLMQVIQALRKKDQLIETVTFKLLKGGASFSLTRHLNIEYWYAQCPLKNLDFVSKKHMYAANIYLFQVNNRKTKKLLRLALFFDVVDIVLVSSQLTLNIFHNFF